MGVDSPLKSAHTKSFDGQGRPARGPAKQGGHPGGETDARGRVFARLSEDARTFPEISLAPLESAGLSARDAGLAGAIHHEVGRRWVTLRYVCEHHPVSFTYLTLPTIYPV